jgi:ribosomal protein S27AE
MWKLEGETEEEKRKCLNRKNREYFASDAGKAVRRKYYHKNKEKINALAKLWRDNNKEKVLLRQRGYDKERRAKRIAAMKEDFIHKPNKYRAIRTVNKYIFYGKIAKKTECEQCGVGGYLVKHHNDYLKRLEIVWLCSSCHTKWHQKNGEGKNAGNIISSHSS